MNELKILQKYKITPMTFKRIRQYFTGSARKFRGRIFYNLSDLDKDLLSVAKLDAYTFRERNKVFAPYHNFMVYMVLTRDRRELYDEVKLRKLISAPILKKTVDLYRTAIINDLPVPLRKWFKTEQDPPASCEKYYRIIMTLIGMEHIYTEPDAMGGIDVITFDKDLRFMSELFLTPKGESQEANEVIFKLTGHKIPNDVLSEYRCVMYNVDPMLEENWYRYLDTLTFDEKKEKEPAFGMSLGDFMLENGLESNLRLDEFFEKALEDSMSKYFASKYMGGEGVRLAASALRDVILLRENLPNTQQLKTNIDKNLARRTRIKESTFGSTVDPKEGEEIV